MKNALQKFIKCQDIHQCNWYHRAYVTSLGINNDKGERFEIFRGLNHSYTVKPSDSVTSFWTIIRSN